MARSEESVAGVREEIEGSAFSTTIDATHPVSVASAFEKVRDEVSDPEVFVYNAGAFQMGGILEIPPERFDESFKANCAGPLSTPSINTSSSSEGSGGPKR